SDSRHPGLYCSDRVPRLEVLLARGLPHRYQHICLQGDPPVPRVPVISAKSDVPAEHHAVVDGVLKTFNRIRGPYSMLLHAPLLAKHFLGVVNFMREDSIVDAKTRFLAALPAASERGGYYVWAAQHEGALKAGLREGALELI